MLIQILVCISVKKTIVTVLPDSLAHSFIHRCFYEWHPTDVDDCRSCNLNCQQSDFVQ